MTTSTDNMIFGCIFLLIPAAMWFIVRRRAEKAKTWPLVTGHVEGVRVVDSKGTVNVGGAYVPTGGETARVIYSYEFQGDFYSGWFSLGRVSEESLEGYKQQYPEGDPILVRCNPKKPTESMMFKEDQQQAVRTTS